MVVRTGKSSMYYDGVKYYKAADIDRRLEFYNKYAFRPLKFKKDFPKMLKVWANNSLAGGYRSCLVNLCFSKLDKDFEDVLKGWI